MEERLEALVDGPATLAEPAGLPASARRHVVGFRGFGRVSARRRRRPGTVAMYTERRADPPATGSHAIH
ncbi:hypothetical protein [Thioalkalivibrio sp.]|uniref:hypothetical protein n=1 Tax=Thioalkalivibrio sp. TaxID=2093813 RepID=UPI00397620C3